MTMNQNGFIIRNNLYDTKTIEFIIDLLICEINEMKSSPKPDQKERLQSAIKALGEALDLSANGKSNA